MPCVASHRGKQPESRAIDRRQSDARRMAQVFNVPMHRRRCRRQRTVCCCCDVRVFRAGQSSTQRPRCVLRSQIAGLCAPLRAPRPVPPPCVAAAAARVLCRTSGYLPHGVHTADKPPRGQHNELMDPVRRDYSRQAVRRGPPVAGARTAPLPATPPSAGPRRAYHVSCAVRVEACRAPNTVRTG